MNALNANLPKPSLKAARFLVFFWLLGWFLKWSFFGDYLFNIIVHYPFSIDSFPPFLRSPQIAQAFYILPAFAAIVFFRLQRFYFYFSAAIMMLSSAILLLHQDMHNDATFVTSFWVALWFLWFVTHMHREDDDFLIHGRSLALCVVGVVFLGGFVGKLTPEYWDGKAFADIFMEQNFGLIGEWVRSHFSEHSIRYAFQWISKCVVLGEAVLSFSPFLPYRFVCYLAVPFMLGISLFTTWLIFSVLFCLMGLLLAGWQLEKNASK
jgi:hypothetical protein